MKFKTLISALFAFALILGINACDKDGPTDFDKDDFDFSGFVLAAETADEYISYADLDNDVQILAAFDDDRGRGVDMRRRPNRGDYRGFGVILSQLRLEDEQIGSVRLAMMAYRDCIKEAMTDLREKALELMAGFRVERREIWTLLQDSEITREEAMEMMQALNLRVREAMAGLDARKAACEAMKICRADMFDAIREVLTDEQLEMFNEWVANLPEIDCDKERK